MSRPAVVGRSIRPLRILGRIADVLFGVTVTVLAVVLAAAFFTDWQVQVVDTGSMAPAMPEGSLAVIAPVDVAEVEVGDVIAFAARSGDGHVVHRVEAVLDQPAGRYFQTRGDANEAPDRLPVPAERVSGRVRYDVPVVGTLLGALRPPLGPIVLIGVPLFAGLAGPLRRRISRPSDAPDVVRSTMS